MIYDEFKPLKIRRNFSRPTEEEISAFINVPTSFVADAQFGSGAIDYSIKPLNHVMRFSGPAITVKASSRDCLALMPAISLAKPGDVLVVATERYDGAAIVGDTAASLSANTRLAAIVTDGLLRDVEGILEAGIPVFCRGASPNSPYRTGPGSIGLPVNLSGSLIDSGDILVGDRNGVVVVARSEMVAVISRLEKVKNQEAELQTKIRNGLTMPDWVEDYLRSEQTKFID